MSLSYEQLKEAFPEEAKAAEKKSKEFIKRLIAEMWLMYKEEFGIE